MKQLLLILFFLAGFNSFGQIETKPLTIGESLTFYSEELKEERTINVYLPNSYHPDSTHRYPVIYLLDGSLDEDFIHIAGLVQFASFPWIELQPESIVVGISNVDRIHDFTYPTYVKEDKSDFPTSGGSEEFIRFLEKELQPLVDSTYKTDSTRMLIGQSLGGLLAAEILLTHPHLFNDYVIVSPSLWWDRESLITGMNVGDLSARNVYIAVGKEGEIMERVAKELHTKIESSEHPPATLFFRYFEEHDHGDVLHQAVYKAFEFLED